MRGITRFIKLLENGDALTWVIVAVAAVMALVAILSRLKKK